MGDMDQRQAAGSNMAESWLRKRGSDFQGRPCLGREVGNSATFFKEYKMKNLNTKNKIIFATSFISMNILCTWLVLELGALL